MKFSALVSTLLVGSAAAFAPQATKVSKTALSETKVGRESREKRLEEIMCQIMLYCYTQCIIFTNIVSNSIEILFL